MGKAPLLDRKLPRRIAGFLLSTIFAFGVANVLVRINTLSIDPATVFSTVGLVLAVLTVVFYNRITAAATVGIAILGGLYLHFFSDFDFLLVFEQIVDFFTAALPIFRGDEVPLPETQLLFAQLLATAAALLAFLTSSRLSGGGTLTVSATALFVAAWYLGFDDIFVELSLCSAVIVAVSAAGYGRKRAAMERREIGNHVDDMEVVADSNNVADNGTTVAVTAASASATTGGTAGLALFTIPILLVAALILSQLVMPGVSSLMRSRGVVTIADDMLDFFGQYFPGYTRKRLLFSVSASGFGDANNLGGPVTLSQGNSMVVTVFGNTAPQYLRGATRSHYTGRGWVNIDTGGSHRFGAGMWDEMENRIFDRDLPVPVRSVATHVRYNVRAFRHLGTIFTVERPEEVTSTNTDYVPYFNSRGEMYPKELMVFNDNYSLSGYSVNYLTNTLMTYISVNEGRFPEPDERMEEIYERYGGGPLSDELPATNGSSTHGQLAQMIAANETSKFAGAVAIMQYLRTNYDYTLSPSVVPEGADFVDYFLTSGEGYCVYFATAMAVMARDIGIPSRYVEGYLLSNDTRNGNVFNLTGENAHAWAELYFEGFGWIPFDATTLGVLAAPGSGDVSPMEPPSPSPPPETEEPPSETDDDRDDQPTTVAPLWIAVIIVAAGATLLVAINGAALLYLRRFSPQRLIPDNSNSDDDKAGAAATAIRAWWRETNRLLPYFSPRAVREPGETAYAFAVRLGAVIPGEVCTFARYTDIAVRAYYGAQPPTDIEVETSYRFYTTLRKYLFRRYTPLGYVIRYVLPHRKTMGRDE